MGPSVRLRQVRQRIAGSQPLFELGSDAVQDRAGSRRRAGDAPGEGPPDIEDLAAQAEAPDLLLERVGQVGDLGEPGIGRGAEAQPVRVQRTGQQQEGVELGAEGRCPELVGQAQAMLGHP
jgi:hypothetical protein